MEPLNQQEMAQLNVIALQGAAVQRRRAKLILMADRGLPPADIAPHVGLSTRRVYHWLREFRHKRMRIFPNIPPIEERERGPERAEAGGSPGGPVTPTGLAERHGADTEPGRPVGALSTAGLDTGRGAHRLPDTSRTLLETTTQLLGPPLVKADTPFDHAARAILIHHLERIQLSQSRVREPDGLFALQRSIRGARHVFRAMGEQFDVTDVASLPRQLRWLSKNSRPPRRWQALTSQAEDYFATVERRAAGVEMMVHRWRAQRDKARDELLLLFSGKRYRDFVNAAQRFIRTKNAGIFGKTAARHQLRYVLPSIIRYQHRQVLVFEQRLKAPKRRVLRDLRRQARSLYHLLDDFRGALGPGTATCLQSLLTLEAYLTYLDDVRLAIQIGSDYLEADSGGGKPTDGVEDFITAKRVEREELLVRLPSTWELVASERFRSELAAAVAKLRNGNRK